jgi:hypothetical protein
MIIKNSFISEPGQPEWQPASCTNVLHRHSSSPGSLSISNARDPRILIDGQLRRKRVPECLKMTNF